MGWESLLSQTTEVVVPWVGGRQVSVGTRVWGLTGDLPAEHGWYAVEAQSGGRTARVTGAAASDDADADRYIYGRGYLAGDRFVREGLNSWALAPITNIARTLRPVHLLPAGLDRFARVGVIELIDGKLVFLRSEFPVGPEPEVQTAYEDRAVDLTRVKGVPPALDFAFRFARDIRTRQEARDAEILRLREAEEQRERAFRDAGTSIGRRHLATTDFAAAAKAALELSGSELLDVKGCGDPNARVVRYRFRHQRFECVVDAASLRVIEAGICLSDHDTGERGDDLFTLESLPSVVAQAMDEGLLVVLRHVR